MVQCGRSFFDSILTSASFSPPTPSAIRRGGAPSLPSKDDDDDDASRPTAIDGFLPQRRATTAKLERRRTKPLSKSLRARKPPGHPQQHYSQFTPNARGPGAGFALLSGSASRLPDLALCFQVHPGTSPGALYPVVFRKPSRTRVSPAAPRTPAAPRPSQRTAAPCSPPWRSTS